MGEKEREVKNPLKKVNEKGEENNWE